MCGAVFEVVYTECSIVLAASADGPWLAFLRGRQGIHADRMSDATQNRTLCAEALREGAKMTYGQAADAEAMGFRLKLKWVAAREQEHMPGNGAR